MATLTRAPDVQGFELLPHASGDRPDFSIREHRQVLDAPMGNIVVSIS